MILRPFPRAFVDVQLMLLKKYNSNNNNDDSVGYYFSSVIFVILTIDLMVSLSFRVVFISGGSLFFDCNFDTVIFVHV